MPTVQSWTASSAWERFCSTILFMMPNVQRQVLKANVAGGKDDCVELRILIV